MMDNSCLLSSYCKIILLLFERDWCKHLEDDDFAETCRNILIKIECVEYCNFCNVIACNSVHNVRNE